MLSDYEIMGLDAVELVMEIEGRFDTSIPDVFAERIQTIGDLHDFLMNRIRWRDSNRCTTAAMFYPIRKMLTENFGAERADIRPDTNLSSLIAAPERYCFWRDVQSHLLTILPRLRRSKMLLWNGDLFPPHIVTVADLTRACADQLKITHEYSAPDSATVWDELCKIIGRITGVAPDTLRPETHLNKDLGF